MGRRLEVAAALGVDTRIAPREADAARLLPAVQAHNGEAIITLDSAMAQHIKLALERTHGRIEGPHGAAKLLGINPYTLRARMRKLGIDWASFRDT
jgi:transcriptional regulator with GAF, ATPase, and Fis domain